MIRSRRTSGSASQDEPPLVVVENVKGAMRITGLSRQARRAGLETGLSLADARARIPDLWVEQADASADRMFLDALAEDCDRVTPVVMVDAPDGLLLEITGCEHLFGGEAALRRRLSGRLHAFGLNVRTVIASAPDAARALARHGRTAIVPAGDENAAVRPLPIVALGLSQKDSTALMRAGLKTVGALADRPGMLFAARFGEDAVLRLRRLQGAAPAPLTPHRTVPVLWVERRFSEPVGRMEDIEAALSGLAQEACVRLAERRQGGRAFEAAFHRSDNTVRRIAIETGRPQRDADAVIRLFRERLETLSDPLDPGFGFDLVRLSVFRTEHLDAIQSTLDSRTAETHAVADLADRLATRFGSGRVVRFAPEDSHNPTRSAAALPANDREIPCSTWPVAEAGEPPLRPIHMLAPPQRVSVSMAEAPDGPPRRFMWRNKHHHIVHAEGPERIAGEWWRDPDEPARDYYRVEDTDGRRFWLFRGGEYPDGAHWYLHGVFP